MSMSTMHYDGVFPKIPIVSFISGSKPFSEAENKKMSGKTKEDCNIKQQSNQFLDPRLSNIEVDRRSKLELNLLALLEGKSTNASESSRNVNKVEKQRAYSCKYCNRKYFNLQALGGHQNAHKRERALEKRENTVNEAGCGAFKHTNSLTYPYSGMAGVPMRRSSNKTLRILMPSMKHKPYSHWLQGGLGHAYQGWPRPNIMTPQAEMHQPQNGGFQTFGGFQPVANVIPSSNRHQGNTSLSNHHQGNTSLNNQQGENQGLDLSLKL